MEEPEMHHGSDFERAMGAVIDGDTDGLRALLARQPTLAIERSEREHQATLLHYVAANGVEDEHQRTPRNAVEITGLLLENGARVDATCAVYGGGDGTTPLCQLVTSVHPFVAGVQTKIAGMLLDAGAQVEGLSQDGKPLAWALGFGYTKSAELLADRGAVPRNIAAAAGLGDMQRLQSAFDPAERLLPEHSHFSDLAFRELTDPGEVLGWAFIYACQHGRIEAARFLAARGAALDARGPQGFSPLHRAAWDGQHGVLELLLELGAPLEALNDYGGTVLGGTVFAATSAPAHGVDYLPVLRRLVDAGANTGIYTRPTGHAEIDAILGLVG